MTKHTRTLLLNLSAMIALGTLPACSGDSSRTAATTSPTTTSASATSIPQSARYIADMDKDGKPMVIGIAVEGDKIAAYACNGTDDEAWFFGNQAEGRIDVTSKFRDTLDASFDGAAVKGDLTMNGLTYSFSAASVPAPAGMYTAAVDGVRASWVLRPDGSATGVQNSGSDSDVADLVIENEQKFRDQVRNRRKLQQAQQLVALTNGQFGSTINGRAVTAQIVDGDFRL